MLPAEMWKTKDGICCCLLVELASYRPKVKKLRESWRATTTNAPLEKGIIDATSDSGVTKSSLLPLLSQVQYGTARHVAGQV